jgi:hypothetical protein
MVLKLLTKRFPEIGSEIYIDQFDSKSSIATGSAAAPAERRFRSRAIGQQPREIRLEARRDSISGWLAKPQREYAE